MNRYEGYCMGPKGKVSTNLSVYAESLEAAEEMVKSMYAIYRPFLQITPVFKYVGPGWGDARIEYMHDNEKLVNVHLVLRKD